MKKIVFFLISISILSTAVAQNKENKYAAVDAYVKKLGSLDSFNVATIADTITRSFNDKEKKARAIFYWIANNIALDPKAVRANDTKKTDPVIVVQTRKATALGFSLLVQEMCSMAGIRCLSVDGYTKYSVEDINNPADAPNHSWNVVQLGKSPEEWFYIDAAKASGSIDSRFTIFTPRFISGYFFADKKLFNLDHCPDNGAWLLGEGTKSVKEFYALPMIGNYAYEIGLHKPTPATGNFKAKTSGTTRFSFNYNDSTAIKTVDIILGEGKRQSKPEAAEFSDGGGQISFGYKFKKDDSFPVKLVVNGETLIQYLVEVTE